MASATSTQSQWHVIVEGQLSELRAASAASRCIAVGIRHATLTAADAHLTMSVRGCPWMKRFGQPHIYLFYFYLFVYICPAGELEC